MTLARRLTILIFTVLALFALDVLTFYIGNRSVRDSLDTVSDSVRGQVNAGEFRQRADALHKQLLVLLTLRQSAGQGISAAEDERGHAEVASLRDTVRRMQRNTSAASLPSYEAFRAEADTLLDTWEALLEELSTRSAPTATADGLREAYARVSERLEVFDTLITQVSQEESGRVEMTGRITGRVTLAVFLGSIALTALLGFLLMRHTNESLFRLRRGIVRIGRGDLQYRIPALADDEFGQLANAFNEMTARLETAVAEVQKAKEEADRANAAKSSFLANMSHELRTPLNAIIGYSEMLVEIAADEPEAGAAELAPDVQKILLAGRHLLSLINNVLDLAKIETGKMTLYHEPFDALEVLRELVGTLQTLAKRNRNTISVVPDEGGLPIVSDETRFRQVFTNLVSNACKFTTDGSIRLEANAFERSGARWLRITVTDTGIGMTAEQLQTVFEPFVQADSSTTKKYGGTGLGLSLSREFCTLLGGSIEVSSESGEGSCFTVELPADVEAVVAEPPQPDPPLGDPPAAVRGAAGTLVLVIDDDADARDLTARALRHEGCRVITAADGSEGLQVARDARPDLIVLDLLMPGVDGWTVLSVLKDSEETRGIPVVLQSMLDAREEGLQRGAADFIDKPVNRGRLADTLERLAPRDRAGHVLLIECASGARDEVVASLGAHGWYVSSSEQPGEALAIARQNPPDLILLSLGLPSEDVFALVEELGRNATLRQVPVYVMEGAELGSDARARLEAHLDRVVLGGTGGIEQTIEQAMCAAGNAGGT